MNQDMLQDQIDLWEPEHGKVIRTIDSYAGTVQRIVKLDEPAFPVRYFLYRYFTMQIAGLTTVVCSVDLNGVEADDVIQYLGEMI